MPRSSSVLVAFALVLTGCSAAPAADPTPLPRDQAAPITLRGPRDAVLSSDSLTGDYGLHVTGDHWRIEGSASPPPPRASCWTGR